jgi:hypothetical protein
MTSRRQPPKPPPRRRLLSGGRVALAVGARPGLWATGVRQVKVLAAPGWWRRPPFLPLPDRDYLHFRLQTAYGGAGEGPVEPDDMVSYLQWCRATRRLLRGRRQTTAVQAAAPVP